MRTQNGDYLDKFHMKKFGKTEFPSWHSWGERLKSFLRSFLPSNLKVESKQEKVHD